MQKNIMLFIWFAKFGLITARDDYSVHDNIKAKFCPEYMLEQEFDEKEQLLRDTPGPVGIKYAYFVGGKVNGISGALFAITATLLPVFIIAAALFYLYPRIEAIERRIPLINGVHAAALGLIAAHIFKIYYFNKLSKFDKKSLIVIVASAAIFLFLPQITHVGVPGSSSTFMPFFILGVIVAGIFLGFVHAALEKYKKSRPPKYIDPYSKKAIKMRDRQIRQEEWEMQRYRDDDTIKKRKQELEEQARKKKTRGED